MTDTIQYTFTTKHSNEILCVIDTEHIIYTDWQEFIQEYPDSTITDKFYINQLIDSKTDSEGKFYDWYIIDKHYRQIDRIKMVKEETNTNSADIAYLSMMTGVDIPKKEEK